MNATGSRKSYPDFVADLSQRLDSDAAMRTAVGGDFIATGVVEEQLLKSIGLRDGQFVIDVGCGSGRLAYQLTRYPNLRYSGTDVVPDLVKYAAQLCKRPDWEFKVTDGIGIPADDKSADVVCFFSVFTHLLHEQTYRYLSEAFRVLKCGGCVVLSFLEFRLSAHWDVFEESIASTEQHLNQFIEREAINAWAHRLGFVVEQIADGDRPHIPLEREVRWPSGQVMSRIGNLGQSVAVLRKPGGPSKTLDSLLEVNFPTPVAALPSRPGNVLDTSRFTSVSARGYVGRGHGVAIVGFSLDTDGEILASASGHRLLRHGIHDVITRPHLAIYNSAGERVAENIGWGTLDPSQQLILTRSMRAIGAERLDTMGDDAALLLQLHAGAYTAVVRGAEEATGVVHVEVIAMPFDETNAVKREGADEVG